MLVPSITIKHLLTHTARLGMGGSDGYQGRERAPVVEWLLSGGFGANNPQVRLKRPPGLKQQFSGGGFTVLQMVLETVFARPMPMILQKLVFEPLSMTHSFYEPPEEDENYATAFSTGMTSAETGPFHFSPEKAAAGLRTTPTDILKAARAVRKSAQGNSAFLGQ